MTRSLVVGNLTSQKENVFGGFGHKYCAFWLLPTLATASLRLDSAKPPEKTKKEEAPKPKEKPSAIQPWSDAVFLT